MPDEPAKPRRKRRDNRPPGVDDIPLWSTEMNYNSTLRPLWDRNLKYRVILPPRPERRKSRLPRQPALESEQPARSQPMPDEPTKPRRKRRDNRPPGVDDLLPWPAEMNYNHSLRPLWDRNLKYRAILPPLQGSRKSQEKSP